MYQVNLGNKILYYPANEDFTIYDTELTEDVGQAGEFKFKVPPTNLLYSELTNGALITIIKDKKEFWRGEITDISYDFAKIASVYVVEDVAWLADEYLAPTKITNQTYKQRLDAVINTYNSTRSADRQFRSGYVYNGTATCNWKTEYEWSILDSIRKCICRDNMYVRIRRVYESGVIRRYIDCVRLEDYGKSTTQPIEYGYNLLDYLKDSDYGNLTNVLTPYGAEIEDQEVYDDYSKRVQGTTISNQASINAYGRHAKAVVFDGVTNTTSLNNLAAAYLSRYCQPQLTMEVSAVDLSMIDNVADIAIGDKVRVIAKPFAVDQELYLTSLVRDLQNVDKNTLTLSGHVARRTLTSQVIDATDMIEELPSEWDLLRAAKKNALALLLSETQGGYVVFEYDDPNNPAKMTAINICDQMKIEDSTKRWRWSQNGLGYMERKTTAASWPDTSTLKAAITYDGHIVADFMDTGVLTAKIIKAGILQDKNGQFSLNMETGALTMNSGTFKGALSAATGTFTGALSAATGTFAGNLSAAGGSFKGSLTAATGTFAGNLSAAGGTFKGNLSAAGGTFTGALSAATGSFSGSVTATSGSIGGVNIANSTTEHGIDSGIGANDAVKMVRESGFMWAHINGSTWGKFNTLLNSPPHATESLAITTYIHNGQLCVDNDGTLSDDGDLASNQIFVSPYNVSKWANGSTDQVIWVNTSDARLKKDIEDIEVEEIEDFFGKIKPKKFRYNEKSAESSKPLHYGVIAQEVIEAFGDSGEEFDYTDQNKEGFYHVHYMEFHGMELAGIKELMNTVKEQQKEIDLLREEIKAIKEVING